MSSHGTAAAAAAAALHSHTQPTSAAQRCYRDALHSLFDYLTLTDLLSAARSCRSWLTAALKARPRGARIESLCSQQLALLCASPFRRHVSALICEDRGHEFMRPPELLLVRAHLPHLTRLRLHVDARALLPLMADAQTGLAFVQAGCWPAGLRILHLSIGDRARPREPHDTRATPQLLVDCLPSAPLLTQLSLTVYDACSGPLNLEPLLRLPELERFAWVSEDPWSNRVPLQPSQLGVVAQLPLLRSLRLGVPLPPQGPQVLGVPAHRLQRLEVIDVSRWDVEGEQLAALLPLPALSTLLPRTLQPAAWRLLPLLPLLHTLRLSLNPPYRAPSGVEWADLCAVLRSMPLLTYVSLALGDDEHLLPDLLRALPRLQRLDLQADGLPPSLAAMTSCSQLQDLRISSRRMRAEVILSLAQHAPQLTCLRLEGPAGLDEQQESLLRPPSVLLPKLHSFSWKPRIR